MTYEQLRNFKPVAIFVLLFWLSIGAIFFSEAKADIYNGKYENWNLSTKLPAGYFVSQSAGAGYHVTPYKIRKCAVTRGGTCINTYAAKLTLSNTGFAFLHLKPTRYQQVTPGTYRTFTDKTICDTSWPVLVKYYDANKQYVSHENLGGSTVPDWKWHNTTLTHYIPQGVKYIAINRASIIPGTCIQDDVHDKGGL